MTDYSTALRLRQKRLRISIAQIALRTGLSIATVNRVLAGKPETSFANVQAVGMALGLGLGFRPLRRARTLRMRQAIGKARRLVEIAHGNAALEGQGVSKASARQLQKQVTKRLLKRKQSLWNDA